MLNDTRMNRIIEFLFIVLAIALPISGALTTFTWLLLFLITFFQFFKSPKLSIFRDKIHYPLYIFILISILAILFSVNITHSIKELKKIGNIFIIFIFIYQMKGNLDLNKKFLKYLFISTVSISIFGLFQYFIGVDTTPNNIIIPPHYLGMLPNKILHFLSLNNGRVQGTQSLYLTYAEILILSLSLFLPIYSYKLFHIDKLKSKLFLLLCMCSVVMAIVFTYCRGVWIATIASLIFLMFCSVNFRKIFVLLLCIVGLFIYLASNNFIVSLKSNVFSFGTSRSIVDRFEDIKLTSNMDRVRMWESATKIIIANPLLGVGPRCVKDVYNNFLMHDAGKNGEHEFNVFHVHNTYLQLAAERGVFALIAFIFMLCFYFSFFYFYWKKSKDLYVKYLCIGGAVSILAFSIFCITEYAFGDNEVSMIFYAILGLVIAAIYSGLESNDNRKLTNILVTGGAGFIGSNFIRYTFKNENFSGKIINLDNLTYAGDKKNLSDIEEIYKDRYFFELGDINDREKISIILGKYNIDTIIHFAAESHVDRSINAPEDFVKTNVLGTFTLLDVASKFWGNRKDVLFHHISTDEVYGSLADEGYFYEDTIYDPHSPYSSSKAGSDHIVSSFYHTYNLQITISNCSNNYGPYQHKEKMIPLMITNMLNGIKLPVYGDGGNIRDWLFVDDHSSAIWVILRKGMAGDKYNIGGENEWSNIKLVKFLCQKVSLFSGIELCKLNDLITFVQDRLGHDKRYAINCSKIKRLGWKKKYSFQKGIDRTVKWYIENNNFSKNKTL